MEQLAAKMSEGRATPDDVDLFNRLAGNVRRHLETLGLQRRLLETKSLIQAFAETAK
jgi:hypothetical protein